MEPNELARYLDQTLLDPKVGLAGGRSWIEANRGEGFASLCVSPFLAPIAAEVLRGTITAACSVVAFPLGYATTDAKVSEATSLVNAGVHEIDMVINVGAVLEDDYDYVARDVAAVVHATATASGGLGLVKVILETGYLDDSQIRRASAVCARAGARFVKTSTGFGPRGASVSDVRIMRDAVGPDVGVKASGAIRDLASALAMIEAGATRIGTSSGSSILEAARASRT